VPTSNVDTRQTISFLTENLIEILIWHFPKI
jgi:hypothetical protein